MQENASMRYDDLKGKIAVVTGASRRQGIGAAICRAFAAQGTDVFFTTWQPYDFAMPHDQDPRGPELLAGELRGAGVRAEFLEVDLAEPDAPVRVLDAAAARLGQPAILVNNAVHSTRDGYRKLDAATLDAHYAVNLRALALLSVEFARRHVAGTPGRIINLSSGQSLGPMPEELAYVATKGAVEAFTRTLAAEVAHLGITVNAINPGLTDTGWITPEIEGAFLPKMTMGRLGLPDDAARLAVFLASDAAGWITGQTIHSAGA
jgi:3-oxoacyl-[acyl-carrier protein] reductase